MTDSILAPEAIASAKELAADLRGKFPFITDSLILRVFEDQHWLEIIRKLTPEQRQEIIRMAEADTSTGLAGLARKMAPRAVP